MKNLWKRKLGMLLVLGLLLGGCGTKAEGDVAATQQIETQQTQTQKEETQQTESRQTETKQAESRETASEVATSRSAEEVPEFSGMPYVILNGNQPEFTETEISTESYEFYSELDAMGRCGIAMANIGIDLMPTEDRGAIGQVKPTGWHTVKYDHVDGKYLYNRCHLIGFQLTAENANEKNLITGTRYMNVDGMLPFENMVADYVKETENHVLYRVTPVFDGDNLVADGVQMEAKSVEDEGEGICFNVYVYNNQPGIVIDYATGESHEDDGQLQETEKEQSESRSEYILNTSTYKFHKLSCSSVEQMNSENKEEFTGDREDLISQGYEPCKRCNP